VYYPAASFAQAQTTNISDIKFKPRVVFVMLQAKFVLVCCSRYFSTRTYVYYPGVLIVNIVCIVFNVLGNPCLVVLINRIRTSLFSACLWATVCSGVISTWIMNDENSPIPLYLLIVGWIVMLIGFPVYYYLKDKRTADSRNSKTVQA